MTIQQYRLHEVVGMSRSNETFVFVASSALLIHDWVNMVQRWIPICSRENIFPGIPDNIEQAPTPFCVRIMLPENWICF